MIFPGALALLVGAVLAFAVDAKIGDVQVSTIGAVTMALGALMLIIGIARLGRARRVRVRTRQGYRDRAYRTSKGKIIAMIIAVIYIVSPIDLIPDFLLPAGVIDDATAFGWLLFAIGQELSRRRGPAV
jgi:hypothetical protein